MRNNAISRKRQERIIERLHEIGEVSVSDLSSEFSVTPITIRRDLDSLSDEGLLVRIHGGAILDKELRLESHFSEKGTTHVNEKKMIGKMAASMIKEGDVVFLNSGSTTLEVVKNLKKKRVRIVTNNVATIGVDRDPLLDLFIVGGEYRESSQSLIGDMARDTLSQVYSSCTLLGVNGISVQFGLSSNIQQETTVNKQMVERCQGPLIVLADSSKLGVVSNFSTAPLSKVDILITDENADHEQIELFEKAGIKVLIAR